MTSHLERMYLKFLQDRDTARMIEAVSRRYTIATLHRLAEQGRAQARRAAVLAIGLLGDSESNDVLGRALRDRDRGVRLTADSGIREVWLRIGDPIVESHLRCLGRWNSCGRFLQVDQLATELLGQYAAVAELWHLRGVARFGLSEFEASLGDCQATLARNPFHFTSATNMGRCYLALDRTDDALDAFRRALSINPSLEHLRGMVRRLKRTR